MGKKLTLTNAIIIDEASMLDKKSFEAINNFL